ncbi:hypothetical protein B484DRAFT_405972, partial [Ochromonadaceae sp. CCMP2298]
MSQRIFDSEVIAQVLNPAQCERQEAETELVAAMGVEDERRAERWDREEVQVSTEVCGAVLDQLLDVVSWVVGVRQVGVFNYPLPDLATANVQWAHIEAAALREPEPEPAPGGHGAGAKKGDKKKEHRGGAEHKGEHEGQMTALPCSCPHVVPIQMWGDMLQLFVAGSLAQAPPLPAPVHVTDVIAPFSISHRPAVTDAEWLFGAPFSGENLLAPRVADSATSTTSAINVNNSVTADDGTEEEEEEEEGDAFPTPYTPAPAPAPKAGASDALDTSVPAPAPTPTLASASTPTSASASTPTSASAPAVDLAQTLASLDTAAFIAALNDSGEKGLTGETEGAEGIEGIEGAEQEVKARAEGTEG